MLLEVLKMGFSAAGSTGYRGFSPKLLQALFALGNHCECLISRRDEKINEGCDMSDTTWRLTVHTRTLAAR
jgi:hypothetical protein